MVRAISIYRPGRSFPSVSVTGSHCSLMCEHCKGHYLASMEDVSEDGALLRFAQGLWKRGGKGFLMSGGCDVSGKVPYSRSILDQVRHIKERTGLVVNAHTGMVGDLEAKELAKAGVDCFSFDVVADEGIMREVMHLEGTDVRRSLGALVSTRVRVVPHILAGLRGTIGEAEEKALEMVRVHGPDMVVLIVHIPTKGAPMGSMVQAGTEGILDFARRMREELVGAELVLGCMRPKGDPDMEIGVIGAGFDGIVQPSSRTVSYLRSQGYELGRVDGCCAPFPRNRA